MVVVPENETEKSVWLKNLPSHTFSKYGKCIVENKFRLLSLYFKTSQNGKEGGVVRFRAPSPTNLLFEFFFHF
jgi:hypothetical protein